MTHVIKTSVDWSMMHRTSDNECVGDAFSAPKFGPRKLYADLGGNGMIDGSFLALIWKPIN